MSTLIEFTIPAAAVALEDSFRRYPHLRVELGRAVTCPAGRSILWTVGVSLATAEAALDDDESIDAVTCLTTGSGAERQPDPDPDPDPKPKSESSSQNQALYEIEWAAGLPTVLQSPGRNGTVLEATATAGRWHVTAVAPDRTSLTAAYRSCEIPIEIESITTMSVDAVQGRSTLTECQRETISTALERFLRDSACDHARGTRGRSRRLPSGRLRTTSSRPSDARDAGDRRVIRCDRLRA